MFLQVIESNLQTGLVYHCRIPTAELLRNMLLPTQDSPSPTCLLDDSDSELSQDRNFFKIGLTEANVAKHDKAFRSLWMQLESQLEMDYSYLQLPYKKFRSNKHHWGMQNIHLHHTIIWLFNFLTHSAEIFFMTVTESRFWVSKMKLSEALLHRIYIVHKSKYVDTKQLRSIYFPVVQHG